MDNLRDVIDTVSSMAAEGVPIKLIVDTGYHIQLGDQVFRPMTLDSIREWLLGFEKGLMYSKMAK